MCFGLFLFFFFFQLDVGHESEGHDKKLRVTEKTKGPHLILFGDRGCRETENKHTQSPDNNEKN